MKVEVWYKYSNLSNFSLWYICHIPWTFPLHNTGLSYIFTVSFVFPSLQSLPTLENTAYQLKVVLTEGSIGFSPRFFSQNATQCLLSIVKWCFSMTNMKMIDQVCYSLCDKFTTITPFCRVLLCKEGSVRDYYRYNDTFTLSI